MEVIRLPKDFKERKLWLSVFLRNNIPDHKDTTVFEEHWPVNYQKVAYYGKEQRKAPLSVFLCVKKNLIPTRPPPESITRKANPSSRNFQPDESNHFKQLYQISSFCDLISMLVNPERISTNEMHIIANELHIILQSEKFVDETGVSEFSENCDSHFYASEYGICLHEFSRGGLNVPGDNNLFLLTGDCYLWIYCFLPSFRNNLSHISP